MSCNPSTIVVGGVMFFEPMPARINATLMTISGDGGDPLYDEYEGNIAAGNNTNGTSGAGQYPPPTQTTLPPPITEKPKEVNDKPPPAQAGTPVECGAWNGSDYDFQLSPNFKLRDYSVSAVFAHPVTDYNAQYTKAVRTCNLQALSINVGEALFRKFGVKPTITSGIRNENSVASGLSQHVTGEAADFQVPGWTYEMYWQNAQWIKDNVPYDQFIFEHSDKTGLAWYHLSYSQSGGRPASSPTKVMTMYRNKYSPGLQKHG